VDRNFANLNRWHYSSVPCVTSLDAAYLGTNHFARWQYGAQLFPVAPWTDGAWRVTSASWRHCNNV